jgi:hypothetical protein
MAINLQSSSVDIAKIDDILSERVQEGEPGFVVGLNVEGRALYRRAVGLADTRPPDLLRTDTVLSIG